jgi:Domain of unknown function (DUF4410)
MSPARSAIWVIAGIASLGAALNAQSAAKKLLVGDAKVEVVKKYQGEALPRPDKVLIHEFNVPADVVSIDESAAARLQHRRGKGEEAEKAARQVQASFSKNLMHELQQASVPAAAAGRTDASAPPAVRTDAAVPPAVSMDTAVPPELGTDVAAPPAPPAAGTEPAAPETAGTEPAAPPAAAAPPAVGMSPAAPPRALSVEGEFTAIKEGNKTKRVLIGFGKGASDVQAHVTVSTTKTDQQPVVVLEFNVKSRSGKKPGAVATVGAGAATLGTVSAGSAAAGVTAGGVLDRAASVEADASRMAKAVAKQIVELMHSQPWASPPPAPRSR